MARWRVDAPRWLVALPLAWLAWEALAGTQTVNAALTRATLAISRAAWFAFTGLVRAGPGAADVGGFGRGCWRDLCSCRGSAGFEQHLAGGGNAAGTIASDIIPTTREVRSPLSLPVARATGFSHTGLSQRAGRSHPAAAAGDAGGDLVVTSTIHIGRTSGFCMALAGGAALGCLYWSGSKRLAGC